MIQKIWFCIVIFLANVIQGITGFAGTILAMPPSLLLVGYPVAKPILNVLGLIAGILIFVRGYRYCKWKEVRRMFLAMLPGLLGGIALKSFVAGKEQWLNLILGVFVLCLSVQGIWNNFYGEQKECKEGGLQRAGDTAILIASGVVHGIFVSGGPLLIGYLTRRVKEKESFRVTISVMWILLNSMILADDIASGYWNVELLYCLGMTLVPFFAGMFLGGKLSRYLSQRMFMMITYVLLLIAGITLLFR
ncbi:MAG: sulfite exporter TauE/SafE family protein [Clostridiales bacterium]|nr:sulfite exporter TauE/SafE family protein [Roseburia sp.]MDD7635789.1 sulfite exporter TauE/SafE family protein [Clostridiales bacterium]MDY4112120.1 sulfite exporter TauE/SafE family protein [Roseburia sp.]